MHAPDLSRQLRREQAIVGLRVFGTDPALVNARSPGAAAGTPEIASSL